VAERSKAAVLKGEPTEPSGAEHARTPGNAGDGGFRSEPLPKAAPLPDPLSALSTAPPETVAPHRFDLARALAAGVVASLAAGDTQGARVALDGLRGLVDAAERADAAGPPSDGASAVALGGERHRRDGR
jgi:hypothetical protein